MTEVLNAPVLADVSIPPFFYGPPLGKLALSGGSLLHEVKSAGAKFQPGSAGMHITILTGFICAGFTQTAVLNVTSRGGWRAQIADLNQSIRKVCK